MREIGGLPAVAEAFQQAGVTALLYDPRSVGTSGGQPRNDIDPFQQIQDYSDAVTFMRTLPSVDSDQIGLWGLSLSASVALSAAAFDKRAKFVIAACPVTEYRYDKAKMERLLQLSFKDRESQSKGNPPFYVPMIDDSGASPAGFDFGLDKDRAAEWSRRGVEMAPHHVNRTTVQSYHKIAMWNPCSMWKHIDPTPVMFLVPETDGICPPEEQLWQFNELRGPKKCHVQKGSSHLNLLEGEHLSELLALQTTFIHEVVGSADPSTAIL